MDKLTFFKTKGMEVGNELASRNRVGSFIVKGGTRKEMFDKIEEVVDTINVCDINGRSIMRKNIFKKDCV